MILHRGRCLFKGEDDVPICSTLSPIEDVAVQDKWNEVRIGPMTRSRIKLLEQQVNSLLLEYDVFNDENFILPKSMYLCMIRFVDNTNANGGDHQGMEEDMENIKDKLESKREYAENIKTPTPKCLRGEREAGAQEGKHEGGAPHNVVAPIGES